MRNAFVLYFQVCLLIILLAACTRESSVDRPRSSNYYATKVHSAITDTIRIYEAISLKMFDVGLQLNGAWNPCVAVRIPPHKLVVYPKQEQVVIMVDSHVAITVEDMSDFDGNMLIADANSAILFTQITSDGFFDDSNLIDWLGYEVQKNGALLGHKGLLPESYRNQFNVKAPVATKLKNGWLVQRFILTPSGLFEWRLLHVSQKVGPRGAYELVDTKTLFEGKIREIPRQAKL